ncbi:hypothetical protein RINTHH_20600 [Richelia intracellularis HH01]|uniref:Uncharacterized protein n=1 Tax=Richelia intracellularis HH01 TaxID=1165094 RepID=M1X3A1_9NOST|nr:hypothetical protein [Richelia intracellularis]CCH68215.1 hypothetical protein RINTHH_20600 [Richelia intracellularis HH01]HAE06259.1 hypothetical protein [Richelia sp.]
MYALKQEQDKYTNTSQTNTSQAYLVDPNLIRAAGRIYYTHCEVHPEIEGQAAGVAINRSNYRGKVIFIDQPALLPEECFVHLSQIESSVY